LVALRRMTIHAPEIRELEERLIFAPFDTRRTLDETTSLLEEEIQSGHAIPRLNSDSGSACFTNTSPPIPWRFTRPLDQRDNPYGPDFTRYRPNSVIFTNDEEIDHYLDACRGWYESLEKADLNEQIRTGERDIGQGLGLRIGKAPGWFFGQHGKTGAPLPKRAAYWLRRIIEEYVKRGAASIDTMRAGMRDPVTTNPGWPLFSSYPEAKLVTPMLLPYEPDWRLRAKQADALAERLGVAHTALAFGVASRTQNTWKWMPVWKHTGGGVWQAEEEARGASSRTRRVFMAPSVANLYAADLTLVCKSGRSQIPGLWHSGDMDDRIAADAFARGLVSMENDVSGLDSSVSEEIKIQMVLEFERLGFDGRSWLQMESTPYIGPSNSDASGYTCTQTEGGIKSGLKATSEADTVIVTMASLYAYEECSHDLLPPEWWAGLPSLGQGDDSWLAVKRPLSDETWIRAFADCGLKAKPSNGTRFLMKHITPTGKYSVAARVLLNSAFPEHERTGIDSIGLHILGMRARLEGGLHPDLDPEIALAPLLSMRWVREMKIKSVSSFFGFLESSRADRLVKQALKTAGGKFAIERLRRDAPYSPGAAALLEAYEAAGLAYDYSKEIAINNLMRTFFTKKKTLSPQQQIGLTDACWRFLHAGVNWEEVRRQIAEIV